MDPDKNLNTSISPYKTPLLSWRWEILTCSQKTKALSLILRNRALDDQTIIPPLWLQPFTSEKLQVQNRYVANSMIMYCQEILPSDVQPVLINSLPEASRAAAGVSDNPINHCPDVARQAISDFTHFTVPFPGDAARGHRCRGSSLRAILWRRKGCSSSFRIPPHPGPGRRRGR